MSLHRGWLGACAVAWVLLEAAGARAVDRGQPKDEWLIGPERLGRLDLSGEAKVVQDRFDLSGTVSVARARTLYPEATVELVVGTTDRLASTGHFYVFRVGEEELFRTDCQCSLDEAGKPKFARIGSNLVIHGEDEVWLAPITSNPRFHTARGIRVGDTVRKLRRAYPEFSRVFYFGVFLDQEEPLRSEYVCLLAPRSQLGRRGTVENIRFNVRNPKGKGPAGRPAEGKRKPWVDPDAVIVSIEPNVDCNPNVE